MYEFLLSQLPRLQGGEFHKPGLLALPLAPNRSWDPYPAERAHFERLDTSLLFHPGSFLFSSRALQHGQELDVDVGGVWASKKNIHGYLKMFVPCQFRVSLCNGHFWFPCEPKRSMPLSPMETTAVAHLTRTLPRRECLFEFTYSNDTRIAWLTVTPAVPTLQSRFSVYESGLGLRLGL